mmetsp:Transcript_80462/g.204549  ORF Transcript_80462/g.204549 Transcript_80462/m.204549 type:complete len:291 (-) Transcript_80462:64-936(-)
MPLHWSSADHLRTGSSPTSWSQPRRHAPGDTRQFTAVTLTCAHGILVPPCTASPSRRSLSISSCIASKMLARILSHWSQGLLLGVGSRLPPEVSFSSLSSWVWTAPFLLRPASSVVRPAACLVRLSRSSHSTVMLRTLIFSGSASLIFSSTASSLSSFPSEFRTQSFSPSGWPSFRSMPLPLCHAAADLVAVVELSRPRSHGLHVELLQLYARPPSRVLAVDVILQDASRAFGAPRIVRSVSAADALTLVVLLEVDQASSTISALAQHPSPPSQDTMTIHAGSISGTTTP